MGWKSVVAVVVSGSIWGCAASRDGADDSGERLLEAQRKNGPVLRNTVSGLSPLMEGCGATPPTNVTVNRSAEVQAMVAADPRRPRHLVAVFQQDRWSRMGSNAMGVAVSDDFGITWTPTATPPAFTRCTGGTEQNGGNYDLSTDHWVTITPSGTVIAVAFGLNAEDDTTAMIASRSTDGGKTWSPTATLIKDTEVRYFNDRPIVTADPTRPGTVYVVWDRIDDQSTDTASNYRQPVYITRSTDDGATWEAPRLIFDSEMNSGTIGVQTVVLPDGALLIGFRFETLTEASFQLIRSEDGGGTWSAPITVASLLVPYKAVDPDRADGEELRNVSFPLMAVNPDNGVVSAVWQSGTLEDLEVSYAQSTDGGRTWSTPVRIDKGAQGTAVAPAIAVAADGTVGVTYYDTRHNTPDPAQIGTDFWLVTCRSDCNLAGSWSETRVEGTFDGRKFPKTSLGRMFGDYTGLVSAFGTFIPVYGVTTDDPNNPTDIHSAIIWP